MLIFSIKKRKCSEAREASIFHHRANALHRADLSLRPRPRAHALQRAKSSNDFSGIRQFVHFGASALQRAKHQFSTIARMLCIVSFRPRPRYASFVFTIPVTSRTPGSDQKQL
jgi:hypothetical protein